MNNMEKRAFSQIDINDSFFNSLKEDYPGFELWFAGKKDQFAYVQYDDNNKLLGFLYLKVEHCEVTDVYPNINGDKILKVGTFKINAHGTKLGEQFVKVIMDRAVSENVDVCYVTIYPKHKSLINLVNEFGFSLYGKKGVGIYEENVYVRKMKQLTGDINKDYPYINMNGTKKYLLSIYPQYHSIMFPDSILRTEDKNIIDDVSYTNSIHKIYVCSMSDVKNLKYGDIVVLYRTGEDGKSAEYTAVATSICVVEDVKHQSEFKDFEEFYTYASRYSVFDKNDLFYWYKKGDCKAIKMTYNVALEKRIVRHDLIESIGLDRNEYWGFFELSDREFIDIAVMGGVQHLF